MAKTKERYATKKKIMLFMPTYEVDGVIQAWPAAVESFYNLEIPEGCEADWTIGLDNPYGLDGRHKNTLHQYQQIQKRVLEEGYDALVTFEHDMLVPTDGLVKLMDTDAEIVYGLYMLRYGAYRVNAFIYMDNVPNLQQSLTNYPNRYAQAEKQGWARVGGVGMGFTLFRRKVLEMFEFHATGNSFAPDWGIAVDAARHKIKQICRFDVKCGHIEKNGIVVYPTKAGYKNMTRVKILKHFVSGQVYEPGTICNVPEEKLDMFLRAGLIEILGDPDEPAVKIVHKPNKASSKAIKEQMEKD